MLPPPPLRSICHLMVPLLTCARNLWVISCASSSSHPCVLLVFSLKHFSSLSLLLHLPSSPARLTNHANFPKMGGFPGCGIFSVKTRTVPGKLGQVGHPRSRPSPSPFPRHTQQPPNWSLWGHHGITGHLPNPCPSYLPTTELGHVTLCLKPLWHFPFSMAEGQEPSSALHSLASLPLHLCLQPPSAGHLHCGVWKCFCRHTSVPFLMPLAWPETPFHPSSSPSSFCNS